jgi:hypothetical protein
MDIKWAESASKHGIPAPQVIYALTHSEGSDIIDGLPGEITRVFVGHPNEMDEYYLEVIVAQIPGKYIQIFHANYLTDKFRYVLERGHCDGDL